MEDLAKHIQVISEKPGLFAVLPDHDARVMITMDESGHDLKGFFVKRDTDKNVIQMAEMNFSTVRDAEGSFYCLGVGSLSYENDIHHIQCVLDGFEQKILNLSVYDRNERNGRNLIYSNSVYPNEAMIRAEFKDPLTDVIRQSLGIYIDFIKIPNPLTDEKTAFAGSEKVSVTSEPLKPDQSVMRP